MQIVVSPESRRGCGYRSPSKGGVGIYLVAPRSGAKCGRLPFPLNACPCCGGGIKPARGFTWIDPRTLFAPSVPPACTAGDVTVCADCPLGSALPQGRHGLIWIGEKYYKTPGDFQREAALMGVSRKLGAVPVGFVLGFNWVYLAHRRAILESWECSEHGERPENDRCCLASTPVYGPGVFTAFKPVGVDLVVENENDIPDKAMRLAERIEKEATGGSVRIVKVIPESESQETIEETATL